MIGADFTHEGDRCSFETMRARLNLKEPALGHLAEIVHDLDLRDDLYQRSEAAGVAALINGIVSRFDDDHRRIAEGAPLFDALYASLGGGASSKAGAERR